MGISRLAGGALLKVTPMHSYTHSENNHTHTHTNRAPHVHRGTGAQDQTGRHTPGSKKTYTDAELLPTQPSIVLGSRLKRAERHGSSPSQLIVWCDRHTHTSHKAEERVT